MLTDQDDQTEEQAPSRTARKIRAGRGDERQDGQDGHGALERRVPHPVYGKQVTRTKR